MATALLLYIIIVYRTRTDVHHHTITSIIIYVILLLHAIHTRNKYGVIQGNTVQERYEVAPDLPPRVFPNRMNMYSYHLFYAKYHI